MKTVFKILKWFVIVLIILIGTAFLLPRISTAEQSKEINASPEVAFSLVNDLKQWEKWSPWHRLDPNMQLKYSDVSTGKNAFYTWDGNSDVGKGKTTIIGSYPADSLQTELNFDGFGISHSNYYFKKTDNGVKVRWTFRSDAGYNPIKRWMGLMMPSMIEKDYAKGLQNLDSVARKVKVEASQGNSYKVQIMPVKERMVVTVVDSLGEGFQNKDITAKFAEHLPSAFAYISQNGAAQTAPVFTIFHAYEPGKRVVFETGIPVDKEVNSTNKFVYKVLPGGSAVVVDHYGAYEKTEAAHYFIDEYFKTNKIEPVGPPWEEYVSDPQKTAPEKVLTKVYYPLLLRFTPPTP